MLLLIIFLFHYYHLAEFLLCLGANPQQDRRGSNQVDARQLTSPSLLFRAAALLAVLHVEWPV